MTGFKLRLHGASVWERVSGGTESSVLLVSRVIDGPEVKTDYADISGINGVLDYSDVMGLYYKNKSVKIKLRKIANSSYNFDELRRRYLGQRIDFAFDDEPEYFSSGYYHVGRVVKISDDYRADFRTVELDIDAEPFKRPETGDTAFTVPVYEYSSLLTGAEELIIPVYTTEVDTYGTYASNNGTQIIIAPKDSAQGDSSYPPMVMIPLFVSASVDDANRYTFQAQCANGYCTFEGLYETPYGNVGDFIKIEPDENGTFEIPKPQDEDYNKFTLYAVLRAKTRSTAKFTNIWFAKNIVSENVENGDSVVYPVFPSIENASGETAGHAEVYVNGTCVFWYPEDGEGWKPELKLRPGVNKAFVINHKTKLKNSTTLRAERLVL